MKKTDQDASSSKFIPGSDDNNDLLSIIQKMWRVGDNGEHDGAEDKEISSDEGKVYYMHTECPPTPFFSKVHSTVSSTDDNSVKVVSVMTQTELEQIDDENVFHSSQHLEKQSSTLQRSLNEELVKQEFMYNSKKKGSVIKAMISFEKECEIRLNRQVQHACRITMDATRAEEAIKHRKEIKTLLLNLDVKQKMQIEEAVSAEREKFKKYLDDLQQENALWRQERDKSLSEVEKLKCKLDIDRMNLEAQRSKLSCEEEYFRNRVLEVESKWKGIERRELFLKETSETESRKAQDEARKTYEVVVEAVTQQREFYDKEIKSLQNERKLLSQARSEIANKETDTSRLLISLRNENDSLQIRLQAAETQLNEIGSFIGGKENLVGKCRYLLKYVKSCKNLKEKLSQSRMEIATIHRRAKEESQKLEESLTIAENERLRVQGQNSQLLSRIDFLEKEVNLSRKECADLGILLQECQVAFNSLGNSPHSKNLSSGWKSFYSNPCTAKLNVPSHDAIASLQLLHRSPFHKISITEKSKHSSQGMILPKMGHKNQKVYFVGGEKSPFKEDPTSKNGITLPMVDTCMKIGTLTSALPSNNSKINPINVTEKTYTHSEDDTKKEENKTLTRENLEREHSEKLDPEIKVSSIPLTKPNPETSPSEAVSLIGNGESMVVPKLKAIMEGELQPIYTNTYQGSVNAAVIASEAICTYIHCQHEKNDSIGELAKEATRQVALPNSHSSELIHEPMPYLTWPTPRPENIEGQTLNTHVSAEEEVKRDPELYNISQLNLEKRTQANDEMSSNTNVDPVAMALVRDEPQNTGRTSSSEKYELCEFEEETNGDTMTQDEPQKTRRTQHNQSLSSEKYELYEFEEEAKGEATEILETRVEGSVTYSMNWSKNDFDSSTVISTEVEESQENATVSLEIVSAYYESSVDDDDNNW